MAKTRLNQIHRQGLTTFAYSNVTCQSEQEANDDAYATAATLVRADVEKKYPPEDMKVLAKYKCTTEDHCIQGGSPAGRHLTFQFTSSAPMVPNGYCHSRQINFSAESEAAIDVYDKAKAALEQAVYDKIQKYKTLIRTARYYEEIVEVWPAALALKDRIVAPSTSLVALSDDIKSFIAADNAGANAVPA